MDFTMCSCSVAPWSAKDMVLNCLDKDRSDLHEDMSWVAFEDRVCRGLFTGLHQGWMSHGSLQGHFPQHVQCHDRMITSSLSMSVMSDILHLKLASNQVVSWFQVHSSKSQVTVRRRGQMTVSVEHPGQNHMARRLRQQALPWNLAELTGCTTGCTTVCTTGCNGLEVRTNWT